MPSPETLRRSLEFVKNATADKKVKGALASIVIASASLIGYISVHEGTENRPYRDIVGVLTVCNGHTGSDIIPGKTYSKQECDDLLKKDITVHGEAVLRCVTVPLNQNQYDAFTSLTFNIGTNAFCKSTLVKKVNQEDYNGACREILRWDKAGGRTVRGLTIRRVSEYEKCLTPVE